MILEGSRGDPLLAPSGRSLLSRDKPVEANGDEHHPRRKTHNA